MCRHTVVHSIPLQFVYFYKIDGNVFSSIPDLSKFFQFLFCQPSLSVGSFRTNLKSFFYHFYIFYFIYFHSLLFSSFCFL